MWGIIFIIIVFVIGKFLYDRHQQASRVAMEGGMRNKYAELIALIMSLEKRVQIYQETSDTITLGISNMGGTTRFILSQTFGKVTVQWKIDSPVFGKHKLEWVFPEYLDQVKMFETISEESGKLTVNVMRAHGYPIN